VPFDLLITRHMTVKVKINGKGPYRMIFDTGAPVSLISSKVAKEVGLAKSAPKPMFSLFGPAVPTKIKTLEIGALRAEAVPVLIMDHPTVQVMGSLFGPIEGILGFPFFARYRMTLDYQVPQLTFVPSGFEPADILETLTAALMAQERPARQVLAPAGLWGLRVDKKADDDQAGVTITEVLPDSAAARAGLKAGDRLLTLDDRWTDTLTDCYRAASYVRPGTEASVVIKRAGKEMTLTVKPEKGL
jgi:membrane-associated protease RseP (regulator of RpoE activity)